MARRRKEQTVQWKITVPEWLAWEVETLCFNPTRGKPDYGARSHLITELLINHIQPLKKPLKQETQDDPNPKQ